MEKSREYRRIVYPWSSHSGARGVEYESLGDSVGMRVVLAVAEHTGVDPVDLPPLGGVVDPDALDAVFGPGKRSNDSSPEVRFEYAGTEVVVRGGTEIAVERLPAVSDRRRDRR